MDKKQAVNPYLPSYEYVPDGEPHKFWSEKDKENRVYVYGSHDAFGAPIFCVNDYVCWSAPESDLTAWRYEGVIFRKKQDPQNPLGIRSLYATDCVQGTDGKFYLYYAFDFMGRMGVAVCDHFSHDSRGSVCGHREQRCVIRRNESESDRILRGSFLGWCL